MMIGVVDADRNMWRVTRCATELELRAFKTPFERYGRPGNLCSTALASKIHKSFGFVPSRWNGIMCSLAFSASVFPSKAFDCSRGFLDPQSPSLKTKSLTNRPHKEYICESWSSLSVSMTSPYLKIILYLKSTQTRQVPINLLVAQPGKCVRNH